MCHHRHCYLDHQQGFQIICWGELDPHTILALCVCVFYHPAMLSRTRHIYKTLMWLSFTKQYGNLPSESARSTWKILGFGLGVIILVWNCHKWIIWPKLSLNWRITLLYISDLKWHFHHFAGFVCGQFQNGHLQNSARTFPRWAPAKCVA